MASWYTKSLSYMKTVHSVLMLLTGFSEAARQLWMMTVSREMMRHLLAVLLQIIGGHGQQTQHGDEMGQGFTSVLTPCVLIS